MKTLLIILLLAVCIPAQVTVSQSFVDDANAAFREVVALRAANATITKANDALSKANEANAAAVSSLLLANDTLKADNADLRKLKCDVTSFLFGIVKIKSCK